MQQDIRWQQRFENYQRALRQLQQAVELADSRTLTDLEQQGLIKGFEYTHELAWNLLKDYLQYQGIQGLIGSRDATRQAFRLGIVDNGDIWMDMIDKRNLSVHTYNLAAADALAATILKDYYGCFQQLKVWVETQITHDQ